MIGNMIVNHLSRLEKLDLKDHNFFIFKLKLLD